MDKRIMSKPLAIIIIGLPGAGKSFFARQFANSLSAPLISEDEIRWMLFAHHTHDKSENTVVKQVANMMITELFKTKRTFVLDGGYNDKASRMALATQTRKAGYNILTIVVQTDEPTAKRRSTNRSEKRAGDIHAQSLSAEMFDAQSKKYQAPLRTDKATVVISGKHTYSTQARVVLKKILEVQDVAEIAPRPTPIVRPRGPFVQ
jgi:hypothetical protein